MPTPFWTRLVIALAAALWFVGALILDAPIDAAWAKPAAIVSAAVVLLLLLFDRWAWKFLPSALTQRPRLHGTWKGELQHEWPAGTAVRRKPCYLTIRQTYSTIEIDMHFDTSTSESRSAALTTRKGKHSLWWSYWSAAETLQREGNPPHRGGVELRVSMKPSLRLEGDYWTERKTRGRIVADAHSLHLFDDFPSAERGRFKRPSTD